MIPPAGLIAVDLPADGLRPLLRSLGGAGSRARAVRWEGGEGRLRAWRSGDVHCALLEWGAPARRRLWLGGPAGAVAEVATSLSAGWLAPDWGDEGAPVAPVPRLDPEGSVSDALSVSCAHFARLLPSLAAGAAARQGIEPVHQMRVAVRRLRTALRFARKAAGCPALARLSGELGTLARALGPARDWDVFLAGLGPRVADGMPGDVAMRRLLRAAERADREAYATLAAYLAGDDFRRLLIGLAAASVARPWERAEGAAAMRDGMRAFAAATLSRQWRRLTKPGADIADLEEARLHAIRLEAKRMRYGIELYAPLFGGRAPARMLDRLRRLQDALGYLNDAAVAAGLMEALGPAGAGRAGGAVRGYVAGRAAGLRSEVGEAWRRLRKCEAFWA